MAKEFSRLMTVKFDSEVNIYVTDEDEDKWSNSEFKIGDILKYRESEKGKTLKAKVIKSMFFLELEKI